MSEGRDVSGVTERASSASEVTLAPRDGGASGRDASLGLKGPLAPSRAQRPGNGHEAEPGPPERPLAVPALRLIAVNGVRVSRTLAAQIEALAL